MSLFLKHIQTDAIQEFAGAKPLAALLEEVIVLSEEIWRTTAASAAVVKRDSVEERHAWRRSSGRAITRQ